METKQLKTKAIRSGRMPTSEGEHSAPVFLTSSFVFEDAQQAADRFSETSPGNIYSRFTNPTTRAFEQRLATLESAKHCIATSSGMGAIMSLCLAHLESGDRIVASRGLFGSTISLFSKYLLKFGIETEYLHPDDMDAWRKAIGPNTKMLFVETPSNPLCEVIDIAKLAEMITDRSDCLLVVDNCACTPALQRPLEFGADVVVHSATKFLDGQGRILGGAVVTNLDELADKLIGVLRTAGPAISPFNAWVAYTGLETLVVRIREASRSSLQVATWLSEHPKVRTVHYPGLAGHPYHELAKRQQQDFGAIVSFDVSGGQKEAWTVIDATQMLSISANFGDVKSIIVHPATTTHGRLSPEERQRTGIGDSLIRLSVGLEAVDDIINDLERGLALI